MRIANHVQSNINSHTDFGAKGRYATPSRVNDHYTVLAGPHDYSPDDEEVFSKILLC